MWRLRLGGLLPDRIGPNRSVARFKFASPGVATGLRYWPQDYRLLLTTTLDALNIRCTLDRSLIPSSVAEC